MIWLNSEISATIHGVVAWRHDSRRRQRRGLIGATDHGTKPQRHESWRRPLAT